MQQLELAKNLYLFYFYHAKFGTNGQIESPRRPIKGVIFEEGTARGQLISSCCCRFPARAPSRSHDS